MTLDCTYSYISSSSPQLASSTCEASSSSVPSVVNGLTYGEIVLSVLLLLLFAVQLYSFLVGSTRGQKIRT